MTLDTMYVTGHVMCNTLITVIITPGDSHFNETKTVTLQSS